MKKEDVTVENLAADESFQNFCHGRIDQDVKKWKQFIRRNPELLEIIEEARFLVELFSSSSSISSSIKKKNKIFKYIAICASFLIFIAVGFYGSTYFKQDYKIVTKVAENQNLDVMLSDLSNISLRKGSEIKFKESWECSKTREVWLKGEAFFDVSKGKAFTVFLENGNINVLGTKFLVKSDSTHSKVILEEGRVNFTANDKVYEMIPGDVLDFESDEVSIKSGREMAIYDSWRKNALVIEKMPLKKLIATINNSYDMKVVLENPKLESRKITTTIKQNDPMLLLNAIAAIYEIKLIRKDDLIILK